MKQYLKIFILSGSLAFSFCISPYRLDAQAASIPDPDTPIDGGISILVAAGVAYGVKKIRDERKRNSDKFP